MRFESVRIARYGRLRDVATPDPLPSLVVVLGPNESGKTTFFSFLRDMVMGFRPATRDRHPYTPWAGGEPEGEARVRLADGTVLRLRRRLASSGTGVLTQGEVDEAIRNRPLPAAARLSHALFRQVYALNLFELARLEDESWHIVQDRLVAALGVKGLRPAREVADELEAGGNRLWRPDRRGRPLARRLQDELAELAERRRAAMETDSVVRAKAEALADVRAELAKVRSAQESERANRGEIDKAIDGRRVRLEGLRLVLRDAESSLEELERETAVCRGTMDAYQNGPHARIAAAEDRLRGAMALEESLDELETTVAQADRKVNEMRERVEKHGRGLLSVRLDAGHAGALATVDTAQLRGRLREHRQAQTSLDRESDIGGGGRTNTLMRLPGATKPGPARLTWGTTLLGLGAALGAARLLWPSLLPELTGDPLSSSAIVVGAAVVMGVTGVIVLTMRADAMRRYRQYQRAVRAAEKDRADRRSALERKVREAQEAVRKVVGDLPVQQALLDAPTAELAPAIERAGDLLDGLRERSEDRRAKAAKVVAAREEVECTEDWVAEQLVERLGEELGEELAPEPEQGRPIAARQQQPIAAALEAALKGREVARAAATRLDRIAARRVEAEQERDAAQWELQQFAKEDDGDLDAQLAASRERQRDLARRAEQTTADAATIETEIRHLRAAETVGEVAGRMAVVRERLQDAREGRDRAFVLARLVREAYRRFREANQPELLRRASRYLERITRGAYDRIEMATADAAAPDGGRFGQEHLMIRSADGGQSVAVGETTSQGTREQVYLAMRLAIVDHLDAGHEPLPIFLDETLVNWDAWRRDGAFDLLEDLAAERQTFVFTCHPAMAAELEDRGGVVVALG